MLTLLEALIVNNSENQNFKISGSAGRTEPFRRYVRAFQSSFDIVANLQVLLIAPSASSRGHDDVFAQLELATFESLPLFGVAEAAVACMHFVFEYIVEFFH